MLEREQTILKKYRVIQVNDDSPFFEVAVVEHIFLGRYEVLYLITESVSSKKELLNALATEFRKFGTFSADYLPEFLDYGFYNGYPFFTRKYIPGTAVSEIFSDPKELNVSDFLEFFSELISKLIFMQQNYITWTKLNLGDFKINDGKFFFVHFNFAHSLVSIKDKLNEEQLHWTEKTTGLHFTSDSIDNVKSLYSLGELLYETLIGKSLKSALQHYHKTFEERKQLKKKKRDLLPPLRLNPELPESIETIILRSLHKPDQGGYGSIKDMRNDILKVIGGENVEKFSPEEEGREKSEKKAAAPSSSVKPSTYNLNIASVLETKPEPKPEKVYKLKKSFNYRTLFKIFVIIISIGVLAYGAFVIIPPLISTNRAPVAVAKTDVTECKTGDEVSFDGGESSDPDGDHLYFFWKVEEPQNAQVIFSKNNTHNAGKTKIIFLTNGDYRIVLQVFDGKLYSPPSEIRIKVR